MIMGYLKNWEKEIFGYKIQKGIEYLQSKDFSKVDNGRYDIDEDNMYVLIQEYETSPKAEIKAESHKKYIDIQYIISGEEMIGYGITNPENEVYENLIEESDLMFYANVKDEMDLILQEGMYAVFFNTDIHRPCCQVKKCLKVKKAVLKIKA